MATYTADQMVGKTLVAKSNIIAFYGYPASNSIFQIYAGQNVGIVNSWVNQNTPNGQLYWQFYDSNNKAYYVLQDPNKIGLNLVDQASTTSEETQAADITAAATEAQEGTIPYYIQLYGKPILAVVAGLALIKILYNGRNKN